ncbi:hypothetical protein NDU88_004510, partial [Pleurodeles waltl]
KKGRLSAWHTATVGGQYRHSSPLHYAVLLASTDAIPGIWPTWLWWTSAHMDATGASIPVLGTLLRWGRVPHGL